MFSAKKIFFTHETNNNNLKITNLGTQQDIELNNVKMEGDYSFEFLNNMQFDGNIFNVYNYLKENNGNYHPGITLLCKSENLVDLFVATPIGDDGNTSNFENIHDNANDHLYGAGLYPGLTDSIQLNGVKKVGTYRLGNRTDYDYDRTYIDKQLNPFKTKIKVETNISSKEIEVEFNIKNPNFKIVAPTDTLFWDGISSTAYLELVSGNATIFPLQESSLGPLFIHQTRYKINNVNEASKEKNLRFRANGCGFFMIRHSSGTSSVRLKYRVSSSDSPERNREEFSLTNYYAGVHSSTTLFNGDEIIFDLETIDSTEQDPVYFIFVPKNIFPINLYDEDIKGLYPINLFYLYDLNFIEGEGSDNNDQFDLVSYSEPTSFNSYFLRWKKNVNETYKIGDLLSVRLQCKTSPREYGTYGSNRILGENILQFRISNDTSFSIPSLSLYPNDVSSIQQRNDILLSFNPYKNLGYLNKLELKMPKTIGDAFERNSNSAYTDFLYGHKYHNLSNLIIVTEINTGSGWETFSITSGEQILLYFDHPSYDGDFIDHELKRAIYNDKPLSIPTCKDVQFRSYYSHGFPPDIAAKINNKVNDLLSRYPEYTLEQNLEWIIRNTFCGYELSDINKGIGSLGTSDYVYSNIINRDPLTKESCDDEKSFDPINLFVTFE